MSVHFHGGPSRNADQPAGDDSSFCGLCGVILKTVSRRRVNAQARKKQRLEWLEEIRGVYNAPGNPSNVLLSGIGFVINNHIEAHVNSALTYQDRGPRITNTLRNVSLHGNSWGARCWTYAVHESCWQLLLAKLQQQGVDSEDMIATALHGILLTTEYPQGSQFQLGHDYGGAPGSSNPDHLLDIFRSDPWKIPGVAHLMNRSSLAVPSLPSTNRTQPAARVRPTTTDKDVFASLSPELICMVMSQLSISEIGHLREASRAIASLISKADDLPQNCWKSQFGPGKEMVCVFINLQPPANLDWRKLYLLIKRGFSGIAALENRQRIWSLLENVTHLVKLALDSTRNKEGIEMSRMKHDTYSATNPALDPNSYLEFEPIKTSWISAEWWGKDKYGGHRDELTTGCRELDLRAAYTTPAPDFAGLYPQRWSAGVSLVEVHSRSYISGIRFFAPDAGKGHSPRSCLGFVSPDEVEIQFEPHEFIEGVEVAVCNTGIVGIKFLTSGASAHGWTGCTDLPDTAFGRLLPQEGKCIAALIAGLDNFKLTSLGIVVKGGLPLISPWMMANIGCRKTDEFIDSNTWIPTMPCQLARLRIGLDPYFGKRSTQSLSGPLWHGEFRPLLNIDFGGLQGELLPRLQNVTAYRGWDSSCIVGLEFTYNDRKEMFGLQTELSFSTNIDGPGGERIIDVEVVTRCGSHVLMNLKLLTNWNSTETSRSLTKAKHHNRSCAMRAHEEVTLWKTEEHVITGFCAAMDDSSSDRFTSIGLITQPDPDAE